MQDLTIKKTPTYDQDRKKKAKKTKEKQRSKRKADAAGGQAKKKKTGPAVDLSVYVPRAPAAEAVPARVIPTRSRAKAQPQTDTPTGAIQVKAEVKLEQPKVEPKVE
ncbi:hypothetical protein PHYPSEUDO_003359 [Phytophthora pseudosyringae]|uniref:Uncharacterized protein n=1 Tax=Phytophthora pseudosyringae TaxID=221518 RepID=A0A8T1VW10_9STRA|nr:hypothetical protein PHYPSEUDO_003359 [Phytophthora pseudosyringae]